MWIYSWNYVSRFLENCIICELHGIRVLFPTIQKSSAIIDHFTTSGFEFPANYSNANFPATTQCNFMPLSCWLYSQFTELGNWQHFLFYQNNNNNNIISTTFIMQALPLCFQCSTTKMFVFIISTMDKNIIFRFYL